MIARHIGRIVGRITDHALNQLWPLEVHTRHYLAQVRVADKAAEDLAEAEATREVLEPDPPLADWERELIAQSNHNVTEADQPLADWEKELLGVHLPDDLWAAEQRHGTITDLPDGHTIDDHIRSLKLPADRDDTADLPPVAVSDRVDVGRPAGAVVTPSASASGVGGTSTSEIATVIAVVLRRQGINSAPIFADLAARELSHHFTFHRK